MHESRRIKDIKVLFKGSGYSVLEVGKIALYLPNGTGKTYVLDKPVKVMYAKDRKVISVDSYPPLSSTLSAAYASRYVFPADIPPVYIKDIAKAERSGEASTIGYTPPVVAPIPGASVTPTPTPTLTETPTITPTAVPSAYYGY